ncbi:MAG: YraN family protein [Candidatus Dactylopiibacterium carminicum]|uniref:UPF0102 protein BGI27_03315 n=1 Tax=Candidatus Dactylopiibacterium carminicum TaxID=857335 RepID=A0A272EX44_9RHOO|nr:YraN family protein [Candidatus Dactylopiibacterium carminicum]KAF7600311.1 YraN family protein [Candidatus Dactylopiibacterium carminicum]PAS94683.1 MAG: YraN family protein [Candidatus Dactylopiibacterium carminicum]PAS96971.1 MAG: YraN family protein [Candidatus Dactylopiibacterium carminicum]PAT00315.1 MAG: YraN family protein [Candidatus Dactylopiibacterium carminicum]
MASWTERFRKALDCLLRRPALQAGNAGARAERLAEAHLHAQGLRILARNARSKGGEIDLIALDGAALVFVEVRLRAGSRHGGAAASITPAKQRRIRRAAAYWLQTEGRTWQGRPCRFDAVLLDSHTAENITWLRGAFTN